MLTWMESHWQEVCTQADVDKSGTISQEEAVTIWDRALEGFEHMVGQKLVKLGSANMRC